jgi:peroxiredoxin
MLTSLCLLSCVLAPGQTTERPAGGVPPALLAPLDRDRDRDAWLLTPRLDRAEELVYRGTFSEESTSVRGVQLNRTYRLEDRLFVLGTPAGGPEVAFLTLLRGKSGAAGDGAAAPVVSVRLEVVRVDGQGRLTATSPRSLAVPLEGPPTIECGAFVELPSGRLRPQQTWETVEDGRPARVWRVAGSDSVNGSACLKVVGLQQSEDWDRPRNDHTGWRRTETVWLSPRLGIAYRVERVLERRDAGQDAPNHRAVLRYELESDLPYPGKLYEDRRDEILQARALMDRLAPLLARPGPDAPGQFDAMLARINYHLEHHLPTPYREAVLQLKRRVEAARHGDTPPAPLPDETTAAPAVAVPGSPAPDFLASDLAGGRTARLHQFRGRPVVLVFYSPTSFQAEEVLRFAQQVAESHKDEVAVIGLVMSEDVERVRRQHDELQLTFPLLDGTGLRRSYEVQTTPKFMVLDAAGVVRGSYLGWGQEAHLAVVADLKRCLAPHKP